MNNEWRQRYARLRGRVELKAEDAQRSTAWYLQGGKKYFETNTEDILNSHIWCFICGCNNSGTSLLQSMIDKSGKTSSFDFEGQRYTNTLVKGSRFGHERVWTEFLNELRLDSNSSQECVPRLLHDWMGALPQPIQPIIVEKTTMNAVRMPWLQNVFPNSYFIGLVRNGYAVTEGILRKGHKSVERGAHHWNCVNKIMLEDSKKIKNYLEVRYEDLVDHPTETIRTVANFIGLNNNCIDKSATDKYTFNTVSGNEAQEIKNFNTECIKRLNETEIKTIHSAAYEMLEYFGY